MSNYVTPVSIISDEEEDDDSVLLDFSKITQSGDIKINMDINTDKTPIKRKRKKKEDLEGVVITDSNGSRELSKTETNDPYEDKFVETNNILKSSILQLDRGLAEVEEDVNYIRNNRTLKRKYDYLSMLQGTRGTLISNKISAARELNNSISKACELEIKRYKEQKITNDEKNSTKNIMDTYQAFINAPMGTSEAFKSIGPSTEQMTVNNDYYNSQNIISPNTNDIYTNYTNNMTPTQHMMALESNPDVKQVVVWNKANNAKSFEIMNTRTGEIMNNVDKHDIMFMEDTTIDERNGIARNNNLNETYPLVIVGQTPFINEY